MKPLTAINFLMLPVIVGVLCWFHARHLTRKFDSELRSLQILGYNYEVLDATTHQAIQTLADVSIPQVGPTFQGTAAVSKDGVRVSGRWIGHLPQSITIKAPGYEPKTLQVGIYTEEVQKLFLTPTKEK